jgi:hypothetical protein
MRPLEVWYFDIEDDSEDRPTHRVEWFDRRDATLDDRRQTAPAPPPRPTAPRSPQARAQRDLDAAQRQ